MENNLKKFHDKKIIIALSGGPDSVFLFYNVINVVGNQNIIACHVNYNYRSDSNNDQKICEDLCKKYNVKIEKLVINEDYKKINNFEAWARKKRYDFFKAIYDKEKCDYIFTGHNLNDKCESYLIQKERKTNTQFFGISQNTIIMGCNVYRPMLDFKKSYILDELNKLIEKGIVERYAIDSTNFDTNFLRNKIRSEMNDSDLEEINKKIEFDNNNKRKSNKVVKKFLEENINSIDIKKLINNFNEQEQEHIIFKFIYKNGFKDQIISSKKNFIKEVIRKIKSDKPYIEINKNNLFIIKDRNNLYVLKNDIKKIEMTLNDFKEYNAKEAFNNWKTINEFCGNFVVTNMWQKYNSFTVGKSNKKLSELFKKNKFPYIIRYYNLLLVDIKNKNIKKMYSKNDNIYIQEDI